MEYNNTRGNYQNSYRRPQFQDRGYTTIQEKPIIPISNELQNLLERDTTNFSLYSPRMVQWKNDLKDGLKSDSENMAKLQKQSEKSFCFIESMLKKKHEMQQKYLESLKAHGLHIFTINAELTSPFITGLGSGHPTETGMILDRNLGVPFLPASSIKGVLRLSYAINISNGRNVVPDSELNKFFGSTDSRGKNVVRGQLVFLDSYPVNIPELKIDIMNPHFSKYYSGENKQPIETELPVPIKFLAVKEATTFVFRCYFLPLEDSKYCDNTFEEKDNIAIEKMFDTAFDKLGFGGKTSIGYGRFKRVLEAK